MTHYPEKIIIFLGPPGSGKGTQAKRLSKKLHFPHIATGDLFRENIQKATEIGKRVKEIVEKGSYVDDSIVCEMVVQRFQEKDAQKGVILDGFPRTLNQAKFLEDHRGKDLVVLYLEVSDEEVIERLSGRLLCKSCGHIHHKKYCPPKKEGICDKCGGTLYQREDDQEEVIKKRLEVYRKQTQPLIDFYSEKGVLKTIDAKFSPDEVYQVIEKNLFTS